ncbi:MAG: hypothetical protein ABW128_14050, partial [Rhizorhabdus sp.]
GSGGKPKGGDADGGRGESLALTDEVIEPRDETQDLAANILMLPSEQEMQTHRDVPLLETTVRTDPTAAKDDELGRSKDDDRDDRAREMDGRSGRPASVARTDRNEPPAPDRQEDLSIREARDGFGQERDDDGLGM